ncbi:class I SAM-dependent methyltransferase [Sphingomonas montanisoli]|uniref:Class I SAM-dependent methyltransferase n=1 Tax=Sphingomonas montanisoli TaxID=2606412 RepID=A0A5D9C852_9SPHN|nr:class I SAM-dependent methyltransferase [Sphingomonas montanisoli]TZG27954.1 class I SAM-dependent methyltransferase [Sphingomonas montanisoli]
MSGNEWLENCVKADGIHVISQNLPFEHPEDDYDRQYGNDDVEKTIGAFVLDAAGFTPRSLLELACGTGHMTASLVYDGRVEEIVASDASIEFLKITRNKIAGLGQGDKVSFVLLSDADFNQIPQGRYDAIMMRSALHHFADFRETAAILLSKLPPGGGLFMLEPRADFHIASSLILKAAQSRSDRVQWTDRHAHQTQSFIDAASFYLDRKLDKREAEDKYVFYIDELVEIASENKVTFTSLGGEYLSAFTSVFHDFMKYCMNFDADVLSDILALVDDELRFMDSAYASRPRYGAAEWFLFRA